MTSPSLRRQAASAHMPLAVCHNGRVIDLVPSGAYDYSPECIAALRGAASAETGIPLEQLEILVTCHLHPQSAAVDCLDCEPIED